MILAIHSDAYYLSDKDAKSRSGGNFYPTNKNDEQLKNRFILTLSSIIKNVMASASEADMAVLFYNYKEAVPLRFMLEEMGHPQSRMPVKICNNTAHKLIMKTMVPKASKATDMCFNWLKFRGGQDQFEILWRRGHKNRADYHTKHHPPNHHVKMRGDYVIYMVPQ